jgi:anaerobic dimethyl sulfoxide reductase subunit B (iron-sulfur subunit)
MSKQYGFYYDVSRCVQCRTCEVACKSVRNVEQGIKFRRVIKTWGGEFPNTTRTFFSLACMHCINPACVAVCPTRAITKRAEDGIVVVDRDKCNGCRECFSACPYGVPQFGSDGVMQKCDFCLETGGEPACAASCPAEAIYYGTMEELSELARGKEAEKLTGPTGPSVLISNKSAANIIKNIFVVLY